jgi:hypothetical protein
MIIANVDVKISFVRVEKHLHQNELRELTDLLVRWMQWFPHAAELVTRNNCQICYGAGNIVEGIQIKSEIPITQEADRTDLNIHEKMALIVQAKLYADTLQHHIRIINELVFKGSSLNPDFMRYLEGIMFAPKMKIAEIERLLEKAYADSIP